MKTHQLRVVPAMAAAEPMGVPIDSINRPNAATVDIATALKMQTNGCSLLPAMPRRLNKKSKPFVGENLSVVQQSMAFHPVLFLDVQRHARSKKNSQSPSFEWAHGDGSMFAVFAKHRSTKPYMASCRYAQNVLVTGFSALNQFSECQLLKSRMRSQVRSTTSQPVSYPNPKRFPYPSGILPQQIAKCVGPLHPASQVSLAPGGAGRWRVLQRAVNIN
jgi:hypothetical protein